MESMLTVSCFGLSTVLPSSLTTSTNTPYFSLPALQVKFHKFTVLTRAYPEVQRGEIFERKERFIHERNYQAVLPQETLNKSL
jgi:hypothetical protein